MPPLIRLEAEALYAIDRWEQRMADLVALENIAGPDRPAPRPAWYATLQAGSVVLLTIGEVHLLVPCFQVLGLHDDPWCGSCPY